MIQDHFLTLVLFSVLVALFFATLNHRDRRGFLKSMGKTLGWMVLGLRWHWPSSCSGRGGDETSFLPATGSPSSSTRSSSSSSPACPVRRSPRGSGRSPPLPRIRGPGVPPGARLPRRAPGPARAQAPALGLGLAVGLRGHGRVPPGLRPRPGPRREGLAPRRDRCGGRALPLGNLAMDSPLNLVLGALAVLVLVGAGWSCCPCGRGEACEGGPAACRLGARPDPRGRAPASRRGALSSQLLGLARQVLRRLGRWRSSSPTDGMAGVPREPRAHGVLLQDRFPSRRACWASAFEGEKEIVGGPRPARGAGLSPGQDEP